MFKKLFFGLFLGLLFGLLLKPLLVLAVEYQTESNTVTTRVGNPQDKDAVGILNWMEQINNSLETGLWGNYNKMLANINNGSYQAVKRAGIEKNTSPNGLYWCTNIVIDSYNLAGKSGLGDNQQAVVSMVNFWKNALGYKYLDHLNGNHRDVLLNVLPGYAIFFEDVPGQFTEREHTAIIKTIDIDTNGNGEIETYDSNSGRKINIYPVDNWSVKNIPYSYLVGFGGV